jgi:proteasome lid subunit RPN8/RPN11
MEQDTGRDLRGAECPGRRQAQPSLIPPESVLKAEKYAREKKLDVLGFYHSHPNAEARPSQFDLDHAWPFYSYIIVSVKGNKAQEMNSWKMAEDRSRFDPESIIALE